MNFEKRMTHAVEGLRRSVSDTPVAPRRIVMRRRRGVALATTMAIGLLTAATVTVAGVGDGRDGTEVATRSHATGQPIPTTEPASAPEAPPARGDCRPPEPSKDDEETVTVFVYFYCEQAVYAQGTPRAEDLVALPRQVPRTESVLEAALVELLKGTTVDEFNRGLQSFFFGRDTADLLVDVTVADDGVAIIDFSEDFENFGNVSTLHTASAIYYSIEATVRQFHTVKDTYYRLEGDRRAWCLLIEPIGCDESFD